MDAKMKSCFTSHVLIHSLFGLGLGIVAVSIFPTLNVLWLGLGIMAIAFIADATRKK